MRVYTLSGCDMSIFAEAECTMAVAALAAALAAVVTAFVAIRWNDLRHIERRLDSCRRRESEGDDSDA